ncbi:MAG: hypothetical protein KAX45_04505 [Chitinophagaceae bacterium]|nr:hypothetical protein [Chitinophagaceae bacterium]
MKKDSFTDRLLYGILGGIAVLVGGYFVKLMWGHERHSIPSKIRGIPYLVLILGLFTLAYAVFGMAKKNDDTKSNDQQPQEPV